MVNNAGMIQVNGGKVFWKSIGSGSKTPILTLHGGPGGGHDFYVKPFQKIAHNRNIYFYDQLGSGLSERPDDQNLWHIERFVEELQTIRKTLNLEEIILWGSSWGTMLGVDYLLKYGEGIKATILCSPCLSAKKWKEDADKLRLKLPQDVQDTLTYHEQEGTTDSQAYKDAEEIYGKHFVCMLEELPQEYLDVKKKANWDIYMQMWGPSEFFPTGSLKNYDRTSDLHKLNMPTLFLCGEHDEATPETTAYYASLMPQAECKVIPNASHAALIENTDGFMKEIQNFLDKFDL